MSSKSSGHLFHQWPYWKGDHGGGGAGCGLNVIGKQLDGSSYLRLEQDRDHCTKHGYNSSIRQIQFSLVTAYSFNKAH